MAKQNSAIADRMYDSYEDSNGAVSSEVTLSGTPGTVTVITVPHQFRGFRLYPRTNHVRWAVNQTVAAVGTLATGDQTGEITDFGIGGIAKADQWETRLFPSVGANNDSSVNRTLQLRSTTASVVIDVELF